MGTESRGLEESSSNVGVTKVAWGRGRGLNHMTGHILPINTLVGLADSGVA